MPQTFDYIIIGAGSAGCVLAARLTEDGESTVLLLEAGPRDRSVFIHMPAAFSFPLANDRFNWFYHSAPEPHLDRRRVYCPRGRVLGGSSSINGMVYIRGNAMDYDNWARLGARGWSYAEVLPYFIKSETRAAGGDAYRGGDGPLFVSTGACANPLFRAFMEAGQQAGYARTEDMNGYRQEGVGPMDMTVHNGERWSAAKAYLRPALVRPNLTVQLKALASRILFDSARAVGVEYRAKGETRKAYAGREVVLCGGAINSPQVLQLSGVGRAADLEQAGVTVTHDLPGVGANLQDHLEVYVQHAATRPVSIYPALRPWNKLKTGLEWLLFKRGLGATNHFEAGGFIRSRAGVEYPDLQFHFLPIAMSYDGSVPAGGHGFQLHVGPMRPASRGQVKLRNADPAAAPEILFNYLAEEQDRRDMRDGIRLTREIFAQSAFDDVRGPELAPGAAAQSDAALDAFARAKGESAYHPACTCGMGDGDGAVVDAETRVHGLHNLRVVDASIMPAVVNGNLNATVLMMAEKAADMIRGRPPLAPSPAPFYRADPQTQR